MISHKTTLLVYMTVETIAEGLENFLKNNSYRKEATTMIRTILIIFILLFSATVSAASSATYSTSTGIIKIYDSSNRYQSYVSVPGLTDIVVYQGTHLYASSSNGIRIFSIADAKKPVPATNAISFPCNSLAIKNSYLYAGGKELRVYSLANKLSPRLVNVKALPGPCKADGLEVHGSTLYVSTSAGVKTFSV